MAYQQQPYYNGGYYPQYQNGAMPDVLNQYKGQYQQPIPQMQQNMTQPMQQNFQQMQTPTQAPSNQNNDIIWVQGEAGAKGYLVAPNNRVVLWDTENPVIYVKSADASGIPSMRVLDFIERNANTSNSHENTPKMHECQCGNKFVPKEDFEALEDKYQEILCRLSDVENRLNDTTPKTTSKTIKKGDTDNG